MENTRINMKVLEELEVEFMEWAGFSLQAVDQEEALEFIEKIRIKLETQINLKADRLCKIAKEAFPDAPKNYQIEIDED